MIKFRILRFFRCVGYRCCLGEMERREGRVELVGVFVFSCSLVRVVVFLSDGGWREWAACPLVSPVL